MFYSDTLLSKTGPLARVWLASNMGRKLTKKDYLSSNLESSIGVMIDRGSVPMALRLSGQLLLGVVRIYNRKVRYLLEDCNEALLKLKIDFHPGIVDLSADQVHAVDPASLMLPDSLTEMELLANLPDISMLLGEGVDLGRLTVEPGLTLDWDTQNLLPDSSEKRELEVPRAYDEGDLGLELGVEGDLTSTLDIERGRERVEAPWEGDLGLDLGEEPVTTISLGEPSAGGDLEMAEYPGLDLGEVTTLEITAQPEEPIEVTQRIKRRKVIALDSDLELKNSQIRDQQTDRSKIVKPVSFLPRDPFLLTLLAIQKSGGFVSSILGDTRTFDWAPELRDVLSVSIIRKSGDLKRKRDSGVSDTYLDAERPELEIPEDGSAMIAAALEAEISHIGMEEELPSLYRGEEEEEEEEEEEAAPLSPVAGFDETTMPLLHPAEAGRISLATRHAVHLLRDHFGAAAAESLEERQRTSVLFQELLPERTSSRSQATKLFFEVLVLATKDAIKVEQRSDVLGRPIQLRAKRGLWGAWAEQGAGGQIQETQAGVT